MKVITLAFSLTIFALSSALFSQSRSGAGFYSGAHDSLLFDGANGNSNYFRETGKDCLIKVLRVNGNVYGKVVKREIISICGEIDTMISYEKRLLKEGDMVVAGEPISTDSDKDFVIAQLANGENMFLSGERGVVVVKDFCKSPPNIYMTLEAGKLDIDWNPLLPKTITICTESACIRIKGTVVTLEIVKVGDVVTSMLTVYEGSATFGRNIESEVNGQESRDKTEQMKKLYEDYQGGKIGIVEFTTKMQEFQQEVKESASENEITVSAGFRSTITGTEKPTDPVAIDSDEKPWWINK